MILVILPRSKNVKQIRIENKNLLFCWVTNMKHEEIIRSQITGLLLAGGQGSRLGNVDKGLMEYNGKLLAERQLIWLAEQVTEILISANQNILVYKSYNRKVLTDSTDEFTGPLQGVYQGLIACQSEWLFVLPVDLPSLPINTIQKLIEKANNLDDSKKSYIYYLKSNIREHFLCMLIAKKELANLEDFLNQNKNRVHEFLKLNNAIALDLGFKEDYFKNLNRACDF